MTEQNNMKPMSWLTIILILIVATLGAGLFFGFIGTIFDLPAGLIGTIFDLPAGLIRGGIPAVGGILAAFLIVRRKSVINRQNKI